MTWTAYHLTPIDFGWEFLPTLKEAAAKIAALEAEDIIEGVGLSTARRVAAFKADWDEARRLALAQGWEGDFRKGHSPRVFWLPSENSVSYAFIWKQDNNGSTFVVSPYRLPWLDGITV